MKNLLITGGMGYLGGRIVQYLSEKTDFTLRLSTRKPNQKSSEWLKNGKTVQLDLISGKELEFERACDDIQCIIHLAAFNEIESINNPELATTVNGIGTIKLLRAAEKAGVERFIYFSTAHVYGAPLQGSITEKSLPRPVHPYAITHKIAEDFVLAAHDRKALTGIVLRLSNGFGTPAHRDIDRWTLLVNDLCRQAVNTGKLVLRSSGVQRRDFITLHDVCRATSHFISLPPGRCFDGLFNLGGDCLLRIIDMAQLIIERSQKILGFKPEIILPGALHHESSNKFEYAIDKLKSTGFELTGNLNEEIDATLQFCKNEFG